VPLESSFAPLCHHPKLLWALRHSVHDQLVFCRLRVLTCETGQVRCPSCPLSQCGVGPTCRCFFPLTFIVPPHHVGHLLELPGLSRLPPRHLWRPFPSTPMAGPGRRGGGARIRCRSSTPRSRRIALPPSRSILPPSPTGCHARRP
jgi:hypothetical protein